MQQPNILEVDWDTIDRRRQLARLRREREDERRALLVTVMKADRRARQLRAWIDGQTNDGLRSERGRMLEWARQQLAALEATGDPIRLRNVLNERNLFPEVDELHDPLGEPPARQPWGR